MGLGELSDLKTQVLQNLTILVMNWLSVTDPDRMLHE
jgi:hypothetical protein